MEEVLFANYDNINARQQEFQELYEYSAIIHKVSILIIVLLMIVFFNRIR
jgi:hypothetical protein